MPLGVLCLSPLRQDLIITGQLSLVSDGGAGWTQGRCLATDRSSAYSSHGHGTSHYTSGPQVLHLIWWSGKEVFNF